MYCDEAGSGKSHSILGLISNQLKFNPKQKNLLICNNNTYNQWIEYIQDFSNLVYYPILEYANAINPSIPENANIFITTCLFYDTMVTISEINPTLNFTYNRVIIDELDNIESFIKTRPRANFIYILSATFSKRRIFDNQKDSCGNDLPPMEVIAIHAEKSDYGHLNGLEDYKQNLVLCRNEKIENLSDFLSDDNENILNIVNKDLSKEESVYEDMCKRYREKIEFLSNMVKDRETHLNGMKLSRDFILRDDNNIRGGEERDVVVKRWDDESEEAYQRRKEAIIEKVFQERKKQILDMNAKKIIHEKDELEKETKMLEKYTDVYKKLKQKMNNLYLCNVCCRPYKNALHLLCCDTVVCECDIEWISKMPCKYCNGELRVEKVKSNPIHMVMDIMHSNYDKILQNLINIKGRGFVKKGKVLKCMEKIKECEDEFQNIGKEIENIYDFCYYNGTKLNYIVSFLIENRDKSIIISCENTNSFQKIIERLNMAKVDISHITLDGGNANDMMKIIQEYKNGNKKVLFIDSNIYNAGLNLENTDIVVLLHGLDRKIQEQIIKRAWRYGRKNVLQVYHILYPHEVMDLKFTQSYNKIQNKIHETKNELIDLL